MKQDGLQIDQNETKLRSQARLYGFGDLTDDLTCHAFVEGVDDKGLKDKLLTKACEGDLSLSTAVKMAREDKAAHMKEIARDQILSKETRRMGTTEEKAREIEWDATTVGRNMYKELVIAQHMGNYVVSAIKRMTLHRHVERRNGKENSKVDDY